KKLVDEGKAAFVWIYTNGHGSGEMGTKAMYCAHEKGQFWPVHDKLMTNDGYNLLNNTVKNDKTKSADIATFLSDATDRDDLQKCLESGKYDAKIQEDTATAASIGVNGTPGFYINATNFAGAYSWTDMKSAVK
ncbi:MAG: thioredoxin domain-containing protein, partial [Patescibacteria group bacterium]